ncbi:ergothioneine biosynthesis protein EgtC [Kineosporia rhizophila]|uniref:ergothioneine biosynthesis protein EgtC n=1 Tax=Kineosporia TaxID=49184 RepID=UPI001E595E0E|nr:MULTISPECIES: ergothioneine biosynthesis protein EgtC [Kineosporia]MCE0533894.1 ergothioneine biosynthesis protein EgtC [Kineosporia rhizophila]GLY13433.1 gamma-glutamyl-hercynylcysteine sulfoxide hydrolase [Kineosporia sp. NBRC 101677]
MCRHLAYVGAEVRVGELVTDPPFALTRQAWAPRRQTHGIMNVDGFGLGWYVPGDPHPARHRGDGPVWGDETFADLARTVRTTALLAAVRSGTEGMVSGRGAAAPFRSGPWLFSHNGALPGWPESGAELVKEIDPVRLLRLDAPTDAAALWALTLGLLEAGAPPGEALAQVVRRALEVTGGRVNLLLTDGRRIAGTTAGASLSYRETDGGVVVVSEAYDDEDGWHDVPDGRLITVDDDGIGVHVL